MIIKLISIFLIVNVYSRVPDTLDLIKKIGYNGESHTVETEDGYVLDIHRITPNENQNVKKPPVFLMHGLIESSKEFLQLGNDSMPFVLFRNGYDVWMGNNRGNQYTSHVNYSRNDSEFWDYSWHEIGYYDLPVMIDFVLNFTESEKLFFFGLSQGATAVMVLLSNRPEYNIKMLQVHIAGPAVFMGNAPNIMLRNHGRMLIESLTQGGMTNFTQFVATFGPFMKNGCDRKKPLRLLGCILLEYMVAGGNIYTVEAEFEAIGNFLYFVTPYASKRQLFHYLQLTESKKFQQYDYADKNVEIYGSKDPPEYDLYEVDVPVYIYCAGQDGVVARKDVEILRDELPNVANFHLIKNFNHLDFEQSKRSKQEVYLKMVKFMDFHDYGKNYKEP